MPSARLNDYAGLLTPADRERLEALLTDRERATGTQMAIAVFKSLDGENLEDVANRLFQQWRLGQKKLDNGVLLVVFVEDRKLRIEVGYGLEGVLPDAEAAQIIRGVIVPRFREQHYAAGLEAGTVAVFDELIYNVDRNMGNLVITKAWNIWMIDHTRAFRLHKNCPKLAGVKQIDRNLLDNLRKLTREMLKQELGEYLRMPEIDAVLARRDVIVKHFENRLAQGGEATVLYELARR